VNQITQSKQNSTSMDPSLVDICDDVLETWYWEYVNTFLAETNTTLPQLQRPKLKSNVMQRIMDIHKDLAKHQANPFKIQRTHVDTKPRVAPTESDFPRKTQMNRWTPEEENNFENITNSNKYQDMPMNDIKSMFPKRSQQEIFGRLSQVSEIPKIVQEMTPDPIPDLEPCIEMYKNLITDIKVTYYSLEEDEKKEMEKIKNEWEESNYEPYELSSDEDVVLRRLPVPKPSVNFETPILPDPIQEGLRVQGLVGSSSEIEPLIAEISPTPDIPPVVHPIPTIHAEIGRFEPRVQGHVVVQALGGPDLDDFDDDLAIKMPTHKESGSTNRVSTPGPVATVQQTVQSQVQSEPEPEPQLFGWGHGEIETFIQLVQIQGWPGQKNIDLHRIRAYMHNIGMCTKKKFGDYVEMFQMVREYGVDGFETIIYGYRRQ
jgi:hypothetical protein